MCIWDYLGPRRRQEILIYIGYWGTWGYGGYSGYQVGMGNHGIQYQLYYRQCKNPPSASAVWGTIQKQKLTRIMVFHFPECFGPNDLVLASTYWALVCTLLGKMLKSLLRVPARDVEAARCMLRAWFWKRGCVQLHFQGHGGPKAVPSGSTMLENCVVVMRTLPKQCSHFKRSPLKNCNSQRWREFTAACDVYTSIRSAMGKACCKAGFLEYHKVCKRQIMERSGFGICVDDEIWDFVGRYGSGVTGSLGIRWGSIGALVRALGPFRGAH